MRDKAIRSHSEEKGDSQHHELPADHLHSLATMIVGFVGWLLGVASTPNRDHRPLPAMD